MNIRVATVDDFDAVARTREQAFSPDERERTGFRDRNDLDGYIVAERDGRVIGTAQVVPLGQFFGGRRIPVGAVASVAVEAESRGMGVAPALMRHAIEAMSAAGQALSTLYASTTRLYRGLGYEVAGEGTKTSVPIAALGRLDPGEPARLRPGDERDLPAVRGCYERVAPSRNGWFDRTDVWWRRYKSLPREGFFLTVFEREGRVDGYSLRSQVGGSAGPTTFALHELVATDPTVTTTLWRSLGAQAMQGRRITVTNVPLDELLLLLPEQRDLRPEVSDRTLTRIVSVTDAIAARGFPQGVEARVELDVDDPLLAANRGRFVLEVAGGTGSLTPGGSGAVRTPIASLAALYTGWIAASTLARHGGIAGEDAAMEALDACFAGPTPYSFDDF